MKATVFKLAVGVLDIVGVQCSSGINFISNFMPYLSLDFDIPLNKLYVSFCFVFLQKLGHLEHPTVFPFLFSFFYPNVEIDHQWYLARVFCFSLLYCCNFQKPFLRILLLSLPACVDSSSSCSLWAEAVVFRTPVRLIAGSKVGGEIQNPELTLQRTDLESLPT